MNMHGNIDDKFSIHVFPLRALRLCEKKGCDSFPQFPEALKA